MGFDNKKCGRPVKIDARRNRLSLRLSDKELGWVRQIAESYDISFNEVLRLALEHYFRNAF